MTRPGPWSWASALGSVLLTACLSEHVVGSSCDNGVCESLQQASVLPCLVDTTYVPNQVLSRDSELCVNHDIEPVAGMAPCRAYVVYGTGGRCEERGFLAVRDEGTGQAHCEVPQLERQAREPTGSSATGWYLEGPLASSDPCWSVANYRARFNGEIGPSVTDMYLVCTHAYARSADLPLAERRGDEPVGVSIERCGGLPPLPAKTPDDIGSFCRTRMSPPEGFHEGAYFIETRTDNCGSGVCLVEGPAVECEDPMNCGDATSYDFDDVSYCSCRCDAKGDTSRAECECPSGYTCRDVLRGEVPDSLAGGYCVRAR